MIQFSQNGNHLQSISSLKDLKQNDNIQLRDSTRTTKSEVLCFLLAFRIEILEKQLENVKLDMKISIDLGNKYKFQFQESKTENKKLLKQIQNQDKQYNSKILNKDKLISQLNIKLQNLESQKQFIQQQSQDDLVNQENWLNQKWKSYEDKLQKQILQYKQQLDQAELDYQAQQKSYEENIQVIIHNHSLERQDQLNKQEILEQQFIQSKSNHQNEIIQLNNLIEQQTKKLTIIPLREQEVKKMTRLIKQQEQRISELQIYIQKQAYQFQDMLKIKDKEILNAQQRIKHIEDIKTQLDNEKLSLNKDNLFLLNENNQQKVVITSLKDQLTQLEVSDQEKNILLINKTNLIEQLESQYKQLEATHNQTKINEQTLVSELTNQLSILSTKMSQKQTTYNKSEEYNEIQRKNSQKLYLKFNPVYSIIYGQFNCRIFQRNTINKFQD